MLFAKTEQHPLYIIKINFLKYLLLKMSNLATFFMVTNKK